MFKTFVSLFSSVRSIKLESLPLLENFLWFWVNAKIHRAPACFPRVSAPLFFRQDCVNLNRKAVPCAYLSLLLFALVNAFLMSFFFFFSVNERVCHNFLIWMSESSLPGGGTLSDIISLSIYLLILSFHFPLCYFGFICSKTSSSLFSGLFTIS